MSFQKPIQKFSMDVGEVWQLKFRRKMQKWKICLKITICMNMSRFINLAAIFSLDLESQYMQNEPFLGIFLTSDLFGPKVLYMNGKLLKWGIFWCIGKKKWFDYIVSRFSWRSPDRTVLYSWDLVLGTNYYHKYSSNSSPTAGRPS